MWKAVIFGAHIILISRNSNLLFHVGEGLKQLIFPMVWTGRFVIPAVKKEYIDAPFNMIVGCNSTQFDYEEVEGII